MTTVPGLEGDYADVMLCGSTHPDDSFLETDFARILIEEDNSTIEKDATIFIKLATPRNFLTCPATGDCPVRSYTKASEEIFVNLKPEEGEIMIFYFTPGQP